MQRLFRPAYLLRAHAHITLVSKHNRLNQDIKHAKYFQSSSFPRFLWGSKGGAGGTDDGTGSGEPKGRETDPSFADSNAVSGDTDDESEVSTDLLVPGSNKPENNPQVLALSVLRPLFPGILQPIPVKDEALVAEIEQRKLRGQAYVGAFLRKDNIDGPPDTDAPYTAECLHDVGCFAQVHTVTPVQGGGAQVYLLGHRRLRKTGVVSDSPLEVKVQHLRDDFYDPNDDVLKATTNETVSTLKELLKINPLHAEQLKYFLQHVVGNLYDPSKLADLGASLCSAEKEELQGVLAEVKVLERLQLALFLLKKEVELGKLQADIGKRVEEKISADQRRYFLQEQLKSIKKELGLEKDDKSALIGKFREKYDSFQSAASPEAQRVIEEELQKLSNLEPTSSEFNITRNYLEWLTSLPWGTLSDESLDVAHAAKVLDEDHYGLDEVKERILEFIAVARLRGDTQGKIICLVGPPGVGKTSIGHSIARALNRSFYRFSVGGLSDVAEIKGHRRTYVGAMPGKLVQCLKSTGTSNPLVLIDEIDKLSRGFTGDPASALLELLDPEQNTTFMDHYLDVPLDLSKVLFVCTANVLDTIPGPLMDRMEVVRLSGYLAGEKRSIARTYLEPQVRTHSGVLPAQADLTDDALGRLIEEYCREAGVRNLRKHLEKIYRKVALKLVRREPAMEPAAAAEGVSEPEGAVIITGENLPDYVGQPVFANDQLYATTPSGVVTGLAWTSMGGSTLYVEASLAEEGEGKAAVKATGQLGDVMKESFSIAHTYARGFMRRRFPDNHLLERGSFHVHVPAGSTPKDGPSAGCTVVTALLSAAMERPVKPSIAMTGEVSLTGRVLPIGGVKEKAIAAQRSGIRTLIFPSANKRDYEELTEETRAGLDAHFVDTYDEVFQLAFGEVDGAESV